MQTVVYSLIIISTTCFGGRWKRRWCCEVYYPCRPVYYGCPIVVDPCCRPIEKVAEQTEEQAENVSSEEIVEGEDEVLEPISAQFLTGGIPLGLGLGWGTASIGPGVLYPRVDAFGGGYGGFFPGSGLNRSNGDSVRSNTTNTIREIVRVPIFGDTPPPDNEQVPEPGSIAVWGLVSLAGLVYGRKRKSKPIT